MLKFIKQDFGRHDVYRDDKLIKYFRPENCHTIGDKEWIKSLYKNSLEIIESEIRDDLTKEEKKQLYNFFYKGTVYKNVVRHDGVMYDVLAIKKEIKKHQLAIKELNKSLKNRGCV